MPEQCCVLLMNNTAYFSCLHVLRKKKNQIPYCYPYDTFLFFSPFPALVHVKVHVSHNQFFLMHISSTNSAVTPHKRDCRKTVHQKGTNT